MLLRNFCRLWRDFIEKYVCFTEYKMNLMFEKCILRTRVTLTPSLHCEMIIMFYFIIIKLMLPVHMIVPNLVESKHDSAAISSMKGPVQNQRADRLLEILQ